MKSSIMKLYELSTKNKVSSSSSPSSSSSSPSSSSSSSSLSTNDSKTSFPNLINNGNSSIIFTVLSALAIAISYADRSNISTSIIEMAKQFHWDSFFSGIVLSSFWLGYALTQVIGGKLADKFGGEKLLVIAMILWSICTYLTPSAAELGQIQLIIVRVLLGAGEGLALPSIHSMIPKYVKSSELATSASFITAACYSGALISNLISPLLIENRGWESSFILFATLPSLLWLPIWSKYIVFPSLNNSNNVNNTIETNNKIQNNSGLKFLDATLGNAPILELLKSPPIWAIIGAQYGSSWGMIGLLSWLPTYYSQKFGVPIASLGQFTSLPYLLQLFIAIAAGKIADNFINNGFNTLKVRTSLQLLGTLIPAACLAFCAYAPGITAQQALIAITFGSAASALTTGAVSCNHFDIAPKNAGTVFGIGNTASCIGGAIAVPASGFIFDQTHSWDAVFVLFAIHYIGGAIAWLSFASDKQIEADKIF